MKNNHLRSLSQRPQEPLNFGRKRVQPYLASPSSGDRFLQDAKARGKSQKNQTREMYKSLKEDASLVKLRKSLERSKSPQYQRSFKDSMLSRRAQDSTQSNYTLKTRQQSRQRIHIQKEHFQIHQHHHHHMKLCGNMGQQKKEKVSKDKSARRSDYYQSEYEEDIKIEKIKADQGTSRYFQKKRKRVEFEYGSCEDDEDEDNDYYLSTKSTKATKQRKLNYKCKALWLKVNKYSKMKRSFPLYDDREIFKCRTKECERMFESKLIVHKHDDDYNTEEEIVDDHVEMCLEELNLRINEFLKGDPLKLCRNTRNEFSGIEKLECKEEEDEVSSPDSSWYEIVSVPNS